MVNACSSKVSGGHKLHAFFFLFLSASLSFSSSPKTECLYIYVASNVFQTKYIGVYNVFVCIFYNLCMFSDTGISWDINIWGAGEEMEAMLLLTMSNTHTFNCHHRKHRFHILHSGRHCRCHNDVNRYRTTGWPMISFFFFSMYMLMAR